MHIYLNDVMLYLRKEGMRKNAGQHLQLINPQFRNRLMINPVIKFFLNSVASACLVACCGVSERMTNGTVP
jgi:hypothetical protein